MPRFPPITTTAPWSLIATLLVWFARRRSTPSAAAGCLDCGGLEAPRPRIDSGPDQDQDPGQPILPGDPQAEERCGGDDLWQQHPAQGRPEERATPAEDARSAEDDGGDAGQRVAGAQRGIA